MIDLVRTPPGRPPRWITPAFSLTALLGLALLLFALVPEDTFKVVYQSTKVDLGTVTFYATWTYGFLIGGVMAGKLLLNRKSRITTPLEDERDLTFLHFLGYLSLYLSAFAYVVYFVGSGISVQDIVDGFSGEAGASYALRDELESIPGVTSLMNVAPWWYAYIAFKFAVAKKRPTRAELVISVVFFAIVTLRGLVAFERRAIFEVFIPAVVLVLMRKSDWKPAQKVIVTFLPLLGAALLIVVFISAEYFKSWINFYVHHTDMPFLLWGLVRLAGYYATAINNGVTVILDGLHTGGAIALAGIYKLPLIGDLLSLSEARAEASMQFKAVLGRLANLEFNNPGGAIAVYLDFGLWGGAAFLFAHGVLFSIIHIYARSGSILGGLLYTIVFMSIVEISRLWFFTSPFGFLNLVYLIVVYLLYRNLPRKVVRGYPTTAQPNLAGKL